MIDEILQELQEKWTISSGQLDDIKVAMLKYAAAVAMDTRVAKEMYQECSIINKKVLDKINQVKEYPSSEDTVPVTLSSGNYKVGGISSEDGMDICAACNRLFSKEDKDIYCADCR